MTIGEIIVKYRNEHKLSQRKFAEQCGLSNGTISIIESGVNPRTHDPLVPNLSTINQLAKGMNITIQSLIESADDVPISLCVDFDTNSNVPSLTANNIHPIKLKKFPLLGEIACGEPIWADEDKESYIMADMEIDADFCLTANGNSMINARIQNGDIVFIKKMEMVRNGEIAAVIIDNEATLKRVYYYPDKNKLVLNPENPNFEPLVYINEELDDIRILGKAVYFMSVVK